MKEIKPTYVTFEQAISLLERGFNNINCTGYYHICDGYSKGYKFCYSMIDKQTEGCLLAPEQWMVIEWLRVNHGIWIEVIRDKRNLKWNNKTEMNTDGFLCTVVDDRTTQIVEHNPDNHWQGGEDIGTESSRVDIWRKQGDRLFDSPQEATSEAIDYVLEHLI